MFKISAVVLLVLSCCGLANANSVQVTGSFSIPVTGPWPGIGSFNGLTGAGMGEVGISTPQGMAGADTQFLMASYAGGFSFSGSIGELGACDAVTPGLCGSVMGATTGPGPKPGATSWNERGTVSVQYQCIFVPGCTGFFSFNAPEVFTFLLSPGLVSVSMSPDPVPEPGTLLLFITGLVIILGRAPRRPALAKS